MSIAAVTVWVFSIEEAMELSEVPEEKQTHLAGTQLVGDAKIWYINTYKDGKPLPSLGEFIKAFKDHHQACRDHLSRHEEEHKSIFYRIQDTSFITQ